MSEKLICLLLFAAMSGAITACYGCDNKPGAGNILSHCHRRNVDGTSCVYCYSYDTGIALSCDWSKS